MAQGVSVQNFSLIPSKLSALEEKQILGKIGRCHFASAKK
jgi:hypothetical protein